MYIEDLIVVLFTMACLYILYDKLIKFLSTRVEVHFPEENHDD